MLLEKLPIPVVEEKLTKLSGWKLQDDKWLIKKYRFKTFLDAIAFVNEIAKLSEDENHHPFISIDYTVVTLKLTSWNARGITELDLKLIQLYDSIYNASTAQ
ncbi:4a-hydroxytetrahydrobiopterin dehydratase [Metabacillus fastidiosus]|nr:4a-hydroxytetrahydrobiopterin dehydratase [Metabacillus fastidiosus]